MLVKVAHGSKRVLGPHIYKGSIVGYMFMNINAYVTCYVTDGLNIEGMLPICVYFNWQYTLNFQCIDV